MRFGAEPLDVSRTALRLEIPDAIEGLSFFVPPNWNLDRVEPESLKAEQRNGQVTIGYAQGNAILYFKMKYQ